MTDQTATFLFAAPFLALLLQPHARPLAVLFNEDDTGVFEGGTDGGEVVDARHPPPLLKVSDGALTKIGGGRQLRLRPIKQRSPGSGLFL